MSKYNMHAFMALFFYELVRDQIVFIWHEWATVVVLRGSLFLSAGPCLQHFFDEGENAPYTDQVMSKTELTSGVVLFMYLFIYYLYGLIQDLSSFIATDEFVCSTLYRSHIPHDHIKYWHSLNSTTLKDWENLFLLLFKISKWRSQPLFLKPYVHL